MLFFLLSGIEELRKRFRSVYFLKLLSSALTIVTTLIRDEIGNSRRTG
jgi:hypothetical protein